MKNYLEECGHFILIGRKTKFIVGREKKNRINHISYRNSVTARQRKVEHDLSNNRLVLTSKGKKAKVYIPRANKKKKKNKTCTCKIEFKITKKKLIKKKSHGSFLFATL